MNKSEPKSRTYNSGRDNQKNLQDSLTRMKNHSKKTINLFATALKIEPASVDGRLAGPAKTEK